MNLGDFKDLAGGIQSLAVALGVFIGGGWALYRFWKLQSIAKARADLEKVKRELMSRGILQTEIQVSELAPESENCSFIHLVLTITNVGSGTEVINWRDATIQAARILCDVRGSTRTEEPISAQYLRIGSQMVFTTTHPGQTCQHSFLIPVKQNGVYIVDAMIPGSPQESGMAKTDALRAGMEAKRVYWGETVYINVVGLNALSKQA